MTKLEYKLVPTLGKSLSVLERALNKLAAEGWSIVGTFPTDNSSVLILQKVTVTTNDNFYDTLAKLKEA